MKQIYFCISICVFLMISCTQDRKISSDEVVVNPNNILIYYWNFNNSSGTLTTINPDYSQHPSIAKITYPGTGIGLMDSFSPGYTNNLRNTDLGGNGLRARNPSNTRDLILTLPTTNFKNILVQFATAKSGSGATVQNYTYTVDGINYINTGMNINSFNPQDDPTATGILTPSMVSLVKLDFSGISSVDNNPDFKIKISFGGTTASGTSGNNRFDNLTLEGIPN